MFVCLFVCWLVGWLVGYLLIYLSIYLFIYLFIFVVVVVMLISTGCSSSRRSWVSSSPCQGRSLLCRGIGGDGGKRQASKINDCVRGYLLVGLSPLPVTVTTWIITFLVGDPYKPSFATVTGRGDNPTYWACLNPICIFRESENFTFMESTFLFTFVFSSRTFTRDTVDGWNSGQPVDMDTDNILFFLYVFKSRDR